MCEFKEEVIRIGSDNSLVGVVTFGIYPKKEIAVLFLSAGRIHKVGPHRIYVNLARELAGMGFTCCRFDFTGIGDSDGQIENHMESSIPVEDTKSIIDYLVERGIASKFVIIGICLGAEIGFDMISLDDRSIGFVLVNGNYIDKQQLEAIYNQIKNRIEKKYYIKKLFSIRNWMRLLSGKSKVAFFKKKKIVENVKRTQIEKNTNTNVISNTLEMSGKSKKYIRLIYSEGSMSYEVYKMMINKKMKRKANIEVVVIKNADHTLTQCSAQDEFRMSVVDFMRKLNTGLKR